MDGFQIRGQFWNPWEKIFDSYFMVGTCTVAISRKNERLKKMVLEAVILVEKYPTWRSFVLCTPTIWVSTESLWKAWLKNIGNIELGCRGELWRPTKRTVVARNLDNLPFLRVESIPSLLMQLIWVPQWPKDRPYLAWTWCLGVV